MSESQRQGIPQPTYTPTEVMTIAANTSLTVTLNGMRFQLAGTAPPKPVAPAIKAPPLAMAC